MSTLKTQNYLECKSAFTKCKLGCIGPVQTIYTVNPDDTGLHSIQVAAENTGFFD